MARQANVVWHLNSVRVRISGRDRVRVRVRVRVRIRISVRVRDCIRVSVRPPRKQWYQDAL